MISQEDKDFLEANRGHYNTAVNAGFIQDLGQDIKSRMVDIIKRYFAPAYLTNLWCGPCIIDMVKYLYTQYDAMPVIKHETFPKHDEPVIIDKSIGGYQPTTDTLDASNPPQGGSGLPNKIGRKPKGK